MDVLQKKSIFLMKEAPQKKKVVGTRQKKAKEIVVQKDQSKITTFFNKNENKST